MLVVVCGDHTVQFARDADAQFYLAAHQDVPALLARIAELEAQTAELGQGELENARAACARLRESESDLCTRLAELELRLEHQVRLRTAAEATARDSLRIRATAAELARKVKALEAALASERKKSS